MDKLELITNVCGTIKVELPKDLVVLWLLQVYFDFFLLICRLKMLTEMCQKKQHRWNREQFTGIHLLSLFCSRIARISLQYSLLASKGIFAWEKGRDQS